MSFILEDINIDQEIKPKKCIIIYKYLKSKQSNFITFNTYGRIFKKMF